MSGTLRLRRSALEICAGGGGQALGLEEGGFEHVAAVDVDRGACDTLEANRPHWNVIQADIHNFHAKCYRGIDLLAGGVPCPPFSCAGKQLGADDERDLFPDAIRLVGEARPKAVMLENVRGLASEKFRNYRHDLLATLESLGYTCEWRVLNASSYSVLQLRPRFVLVGLHHEYWPFFQWPVGQNYAPTVGDVLWDLMAARGWRGARAWRDQANAIAPTIVGGSKKHGGPDLGPTRARLAWQRLGVDGLGIANEAPGPDWPVNAHPRLTLDMVARLQGFPDSWHFAGKKTSAYQQIGNAFPPPVACSVAGSIYDALAMQPAGILLQQPIVIREEQDHEQKDAPCQDRWAHGQSSVPI